MDSLMTHNLTSIDIARRSDAAHRDAALDAAPATSTDSDEHTNLQDRIDSTVDSVLFLHNALVDRKDGLSEREVRGLASYLGGILKLLGGTAVAVAMAPVVMQTIDLAASASGLLN